MKRNGDIRSLFQKAAKKAAAIDPSPDEKIVEEQNQEEDRVQVEEHNQVASFRSNPAE